MKKKSYGKMSDYNHIITNTQKISQTTISAALNNKINTYTQAKTNPKIIIKKNRIQQVKCQNGDKNCNFCKKNQ